MTAFTGEVRDFAVVILFSLSFIPADHGMADIVAVAVDTLQACRGMDIFFGTVFFGANPGDRMAAEAALVIWFVRDIEKHTVFCIEYFRSIPDKGNHCPFSIIRIRTVINIPGSRKAGGHSSDFSKTRCRSGRPPEVMAQYLLGPFAVALHSRGIMAAHAVDFEFSGYVPPGFRAGFIAF